MFGSASRIEMRSVSADFCATTGDAAASRAAAKIEPSLNCKRILPSGSFAFSNSKHCLMPGGTLPSLRRRGPWGPARRCGSARPRCGSADGSGSRAGCWPDRASRRRARHPGRRAPAPASARRRAAPACRDGAASRNSASVSLRSTMRPRYMTATSLATCSHHREIVADEQIGQAELAPQVAPAGSGSAPAPRRRAPRSARRRPRCAARAPARGRSRRAGAARRRAAPA